MPSIVSSVSDSIWLLDGSTDIPRTCDGILIQSLLFHNWKNPLFTCLDDIYEILKRYDGTFSLGDSLRPGCQHDAAQLAEFKTLGELTRRVFNHDVQVMVEGLGV